MNSSFEGYVQKSSQAGSVDSTAREVNLLQLGIGSVGRKLIDRVCLRNQAKGGSLRFNYLGLADKSGVFFRQKGFTSHHLRAVARQKREGGKLEDLLPSEGVGLEEMGKLFGRSGIGVLVDVTDGAGLQDAYVEALGKGWSVVVANKVPLTEISPEKFFDLRKASFGYETTVGAGLPVISTLNQLRNQDETIEEISAILSGSASFILSQLEEGVGLAEAVAAAKRSGFTEPNPVEDLVGNDLKRKGLILGRTLGQKITLDDVQVKPLVPIEEESYTETQLEEELRSYQEEFASRLSSAESRNERLRYLVRVRESEVEVSLAEVSKDSPLAAGSSVANVVQFKTKNYEDPCLTISGPGAGAEVTAGGVFSEINQLA